ncbi:hypothetical protein QWZ10_00995 [Paracoccus cavernae]|uniref:Uncharacterized protein n=1 Tax=Paracoccus cavernae TaxID=1571207 RepID=A0ABT8D2C5_9RHOB|nr:hypothetical protein [Paracoccus cavernae]
MAEALATISEVSGLGMIQIRADLAASGAAIAGAAGWICRSRPASRKTLPALWAGCRPTNCCWFCLPPRSRA